MLSSSVLTCCWKDSPRPTQTSAADALPHFSYKDDLAGQRLRKPLSGNEALTTAVAETFGEHILAHLTIVLANCHRFLCVIFASCFNLMTSSV